MYKADVLYEDTCIRVYDPEKKELTVLEILYEVGFNSKSSFNSSISISTILFCSFSSDIFSLTFSLNNKTEK